MPHFDLDINHLSLQRHLYPMFIFVGLECEGLGTLCHDERAPFSWWFRFALDGFYYYRSIDFLYLVYDVHQSDVWRLDQRSDGKVRFDGELRRFSGFDGSRSFVKRLFGGRLLDPVIPSRHLLLSEGSNPVKISCIEGSTQLR